MKIINTAIAIAAIGVSTSVLAGPDGDRVTAFNKPDSRSNSAEVAQITHTTGFAKYQPYRNVAAAIAPDTEIAAFERTDKPVRVKRRDRNI